MSEVNVFVSDHNELDQLHVLKDVQLVEPEPDLDGGNDSIIVNTFQVPLFMTVRSPTDELLSRTGLALNEGSSEIWCTKGGPCQRPALSSTQKGHGHMMLFIAYFFTYNSFDCKFF